MGKAKHLHAHEVVGEVRVLHVPEGSLYLMRYMGDGELRLSGKPVNRSSLCLGEWCFTPCRPRATDLLQ